MQRCPQIYHPNNQGKQVTYYQLHIPKHWSTEKKQCINYKQALDTFILQKLLELAIIIYLKKTLTKKK